MQKCTKLSEISQRHPYNALWAQLGDLYGAIGHPTKISKTIVCGNETLLMNKLLNVLTYFIRCGEIRRSTASEVINQDEIRDVLYGARSETSTVVASAATAADVQQLTTTKSRGLTRSATCLKDLTSVESNGIAHMNRYKSDKIILNDIPNVLAFRNSRFVRQELRIGNLSMDTGIEMDRKQKRQIEKYQVKSVDGLDNLLCETAAEAIDYELEASSAADDDLNSLSRLITANSLGSTKNSTVKLLWGIEPVKEGIIEEQWQNLEKRDQLQTSTDKLKALTDDIVDIKTEAHPRQHQNGVELKRSKSLYTKSVTVIRKRRVRKPSQDSMNYHSDVEVNDIFPTKTDLKSYSSLSDLITANSVGVSDRLVWGIERIKEGICHEEEKHFEYAAKRIEKEHNLNPNPNVLFMLGENDVLAGLKTSTPTPTPSIADDSQSTFDNNSILNESMAGEDESTSSSTGATAMNDTATVASSTMTSSSTTTTTNSFSTPKKKCTHQKHSGVKFNFEQYPQIVTNYMKNKNLDLADYDFLEKGLKMDGFGASTSVLPPPFPQTGSKIEEEEEEEICECCANSRILQTPSNATELDFSSDDVNYPPPPLVSNATLSARKQSIGGKTKSLKEDSCDCCANSLRATQTPSNATELDFNNDDGNYASALSRKQSIGSQVVTNAVIEKPDIKITEIYDRDDEDEKTREMYVINLPIPKSMYNKHSTGRQPGFVPSLFVGITDHYISDMVLQVIKIISSNQNTMFHHKISILGHNSTNSHLGASVETKSCLGLSMCRIRTDSNRKHCHYC